MDFSLLIMDHVILVHQIPILEQEHVHVLVVDQGMNLTLNKMDVILVEQELIPQVEVSV